MSWFLLVVGLILFISLVVVHEFGHFLVARRNGIEVEEFGIGFPPRAMTLTKKKGTIFSLNWLPLGGFVKLKGEHDADTTPGSFGAASLPAKTKVMLAGIGMNFLVAFLMLTVLAFLGLPKFIDNQFTVQRDTAVVKNEVLVGFVENGSPAAKAGIQARQELVSIGPVGQPQKAVANQGQLPKLTKEFAGQTVVVTLRQGGVTTTKTVHLRSAAEVAASQKTDQPKGYMGISPTEYTLRRSTWSAPIVALGLMKQVTVMTYQGIGHALSELFQGNTSQASAQVSGPVGIFMIIKDGSFLGYQFVLLIVAIISLTLAIINLLPIPALDGGRLYILLLSRLLKKPLSTSREELINGVGFAFLMLLFAVVTFVDIKRFF
jgi:regulator of sigma E protease